jgi:hypothetical protein
VTNRERKRPCELHSKLGLSSMGRSAFMAWVISCPSSM